VFKKSGTTGKAADCVDNALLMIDSPSIKK
jgi:hypothetical protein